MTAAGLIPELVAGLPAGAPSRRTDAHLRTGVRLHFVEQGPATGRPFLFLHGVTDSHFSFSRILPLLPAEWRVIVPDQRGHGDSDKPAGGYALERFAADAVALLDALGIGKATVVGHSMGSMVAQRMALAAPDRVEKLVLVGSTARPADNPIVHEMQRACATLTDPVDPAFIREFQESTVYRVVPAGFMDRVIEESRKLPAHVWKGAFDEMAVAPPVTHLEVPTLILWGDRDIFTRQEQDTLVQAIPGSELRVLKDVGHTPHWEVPEVFVRHLETF